MATAYRADQVGTLLRPPRLKDARAAFGKGGIGQAKLEQIQDEAILAALRRQQTIGIDLFTDGDFRRSGFQSDMVEAVEAFVDTGRPAVVRMWQGPGGEPVEQGTRQVVSGNLRAVRRCGSTDGSKLR